MSYRGFPRHSFLWTLGISLPVGVKIVDISLGDLGKGKGFGEMYLSLMLFCTVVYLVVLVVLNW